MGLRPSPSGDAFRFCAIRLDCFGWQYRTSSYSHFDLKYHFVWITKYRKSILADAVEIQLHELVREICRTNEIEILEGSVSRDHVHVLLSCPPNLSSSKIMQLIKGKSSRKLLMEFKHLQKAC